MHGDRCVATGEVDFDFFQEKLGYVFKNRSHLLEALTHRSYANEHSTTHMADNERLEFLGDAVLSLAISARLLRQQPEADEGSLTLLRSELVNAESLASLARTLQLGDFLLLGRGEARSGGNARGSLLADALEAVFGAVFTDGGYIQAAAVIEKIFEPYLTTPADLYEGDAKTRLQEWLQGRRQPLPVYHLVFASGPDHQRCYEIEVLVGSQVLGRGTGGSKKRAEQAAARQALQTLEQIDNE